jgi:hypothetical protein
MRVDQPSPLRSGEPKPHAWACDNGTLRSGKGKWQRHRKPTRAHSCGTTISLRGGEPKSRAWLRDNGTLHDKQEN